MIVLLVAAGIVGGSDEDDSKATTTVTAAPTAVAPSAAQTPSFSRVEVPTSEPVTTPEVAPTPTQPQVNSSQRNATQTAQQYIDMSTFFYSGLISQLEYEGFTTAQAEYGANAAY